MGDFDAALAVAFTGLFVILMGVAASIGEIESFLFIDFAKEWGTVAGPTERVGEIGSMLIAFASLLTAVIFLDRA